MREENFLLIHLLFNCLKFTARNRSKTKTFERMLQAILNKKANNELSIGKADPKGGKKVDGFTISP